MTCPQRTPETPRPAAWPAWGTPAARRSLAGNGLWWDDSERLPARDLTDEDDGAWALFFGGTPPTGHDPSCLEVGRPLRAWRCPWCQRPLDAAGGEPADLSDAGGPR